MTTQATQAAATTSHYYNLTSQGVGFLNRPRTVEVKGKGGKSNQYYAANIQALRGDKESPEKTPFSVRITGTEAKELFAKLLADFPDLLHKNFNKRPKVFCGFSIGDILPASYKRKDTDEEALNIDGRLLKFTFINVDGKSWYPAPAEQSQPASTAAMSEEQPQAKAA